VTDLDRLFADLRMATPGRASVQEIGHFAAHRGERDTGISLQRANDIQTSARLWQRQMNGKRPSIEAIGEAGRANFAIMPDSKIREKVGLSRQTATQSFSKGLRKLSAGKPLKAREADVVQVFGLSMMWQYALDDALLVNDFTDLLVADGALASDFRTDFEKVHTFISLYALSIMHGSKLKLIDGELAQLRLATSDAGLLRIKAEIPFVQTPIPMMTIVPLFESSLTASQHCDPSLLVTQVSPLPVDIEDGRLIVLA